MVLKDKYTDHNFKCAKDKNGKGYVNASVGLLTYDEIVFSGCGSGIYKGYICYSSTGTQLGTISSASMSPAGYLNTSVVYLWATSSGLGTQHIGFGANYRPVINLKADVEWASGTGTSTSPYKIK